MENLDISVVIPTWNREHILKELLCTLKRDRETYKYGDVEVIVVDSSEGDQKNSIIKSCEEYEAVYYNYEHSVRKKRNFGIRAAKGPIILFLDSDVTVSEGLLNYHAETYLNTQGINLGGVLGLTEFVGKLTFWWRVLECSAFVDSFSFAKKYPYNSWTIGNNVSFKKSVLEEIGMFEENFPFRLGGDDLDMSYRVTKAGYFIKSCPDAVAYHSRETWNNFKAIKDRAKRWGTMEYHIGIRHPELMKRDIPRTGVIMTFLFFVFGMHAILTRNFLAIYAYLFWILLNSIGLYSLHVSNGGFKNPFYYVIAKMVQTLYQVYRVKEGLHHKSLSGIFRSMCFSIYQIKYSMKHQAQRMWIWVTTLIITMLSMAFVF